MSRAGILPAAARRMIAPIGIPVTSWTCCTVSSMLSSGVGVAFTFVSCWWLVCNSERRCGQQVRGGVVGGGRRRLGRSALLRRRVRLGNDRGAALGVALGARPAEGAHAALEAVGHRDGREL